MSRHILEGDPPIEVILRRSARARRISLRVSRLDGRVTLTLPRGVREGEALGFASEKRDWLRRQLADRPEDVLVAPGHSVPIEGRLHRVEAGETRRIQRNPGLVLVPEGDDRAGVRLAAFLKQAARDRLVPVCDHYARRLGRPYSRITLRDTRSRWGSCSSHGALMFSWRLIMAPPEVLDYVAAHEVAHLAEMNHSPAFWQVVERIHGPYEEPRQWLRQNGESLHRYRFGN
ncbi:M48 family metallopeptidase [Shimia biformata]|uniref:M48 family metallopeptidase n=1 Tax=Shimia biformata TaxID=1294299 RepID=UPI0019515356|nr:SprT family zinc-dependent metalloprotease [Shimia biformata]